MSTESSKAIKPIHLEFLSPAPIGTPMHFMDVAPVKLLNRYHTRITASWRAVPLPDELYVIDKMPLNRKKYSFPIVTNVDFMLARCGEGPVWHCYEREFTDLKFVATTSLICIGISRVLSSVELFVVAA